MATGSGELPSEIPKEGNIDRSLSETVRKDTPYTDVVALPMYQQEELPCSDSQPYLLKRKEDIQGTEEVAPSNAFRDSGNG